MPLLRDPLLLQTVFLGWITALITAVDFCIPASYLDTLLPLLFTLFSSPFPFPSPPTDRNMHVRIPSIVDHLGILALETCTCSQKEISSVSSSGSVWQSLAWPEAWLSRLKFSLSWNWGTTNTPAWLRGSLPKHSSIKFTHAVLQGTSS